MGDQRFKGINVLMGKYRGPAGAPIVRIAQELSEMERAIHREWGSGARNPPLSVQYLKLEG